MKTKQQQEKRKHVIVMPYLTVPEHPHISPTFIV